MGIFGALNTAVTGMRAQSFALENVSGNIANSQTTAFKRMDTSFVDLIPDDWMTENSPFSTTTENRQAYVDYLTRRLDAPRHFVEEAIRAR